MFILYEMAFIVKHLPKIKTLTVAKRCVDQVLKAGGYVSKIESLGLQDLPQTMEGNSKGSYFVVRFVAPTASLDSIKTAVKLDEELLRRFFVVITKNKPVECTLHDELKPPIYRSEVQKMIKEADERKPKVPYPERNVELLL
ncbi:probable 28S ribosomal protein S6, mitochondrial [Hyalella azteca]|uniref:Small ribosomal subunit protein bS6m n=1 Tax=Hyalella azteca TaxID=294128 RepID=A0A8B7NQN0_HYAAZ|nr:probable 28S ribosomal protein S6, mitochondrial [Hyalella azteca]